MRPSCKEAPRPTSHRSLSDQRRRRRRVRDRRQLPRQAAARGAGSGRLAGAEDVAQLVRWWHVQGWRCSRWGGVVLLAVLFPCSRILVLILGAAAIALIPLLAQEQGLISAQLLLGLGLVLLLNRQLFEALLLLLLRLDPLPPHVRLHYSQGVARIGESRVQALLLRVRHQEPHPELLDAVHGLGPLVRGPGQELRKQAQRLWLLHDAVGPVAAVL
mmetsp:Transcript_15359/g.41913  ORF Transcript_15359/g.41913 Transcript_15359/m.41913 type:complete len:216 (-) Transcript_15359:364-1011(-)